MRIVNDIKAEHVQNIGNSGTIDNPHYGERYPHDFVLTQTKLVYAGGNNEDRNMFRYALLNDTSKGYCFGDPRQGGQSVYRTAFDGETIWALGFYQNGNSELSQWFIHGVKESDGSPVVPQSFKELPKRGNDATYNAIPTNLWGMNTGDATDMQGDIISFEASAGFFYISLVDTKTNRRKLVVIAEATGKIKVVALGGISTIRIMDGFAFIQKENSIGKYRIQKDGLPATVAEATIKTTYTPLSFDYYAKEQLIYVADIKEQIRKYSLSGKQVDVFGIAAGTANSYDKNPTYSRDKFCFQGYDGVTRTTIRVNQQDGGYWVLNSGAEEILHFTAQDQYINNLQYLSQNLECQKDANDHICVYANGKQYRVSYKPISWELAAIYTKQIPIAYFQDAMRYRIYNVVTVQGITYAALYKGETFYQIEIRNTLPIRFTGQQWDAGTRMDKDGSLLSYLQDEVAEPNAYITINRKPLLRIEKNNPVYGDTEQLHRVAVTLQDAIDHRKRELCLATTDSGVFILHAAGTGYVLPDNKGIVPLSGYHLEGIKGNEYLWKTALATHLKYELTTPPDGSHDLGNGIKGNNGHLLVVGNYVLKIESKEYYQDGQSLVVNLFTDKGELIGTWGNNSGNTDPASIRFMPDMAHHRFFDGNTLQGAATLIDNEIHLFLQGESYHKSIMHLKLTGLDTIRYEEDIDKPDYGVNLMDGLITGRSLKEGHHRWTATDSKNIFYTELGTMNLRPVNHSSIRIVAEGEDDLNTVKCDLSDFKIPCTLRCLLRLHEFGFVIGDRENSIKLLSSEGNELLRIEQVVNGEIPDAPLTVNGIPLGPTVNELKYPQPHYGWLTLEIDSNKITCDLAGWKRVELPVKADSLGDFRFTRTGGRSLLSIQEMWMK